VNTADCFEVLLQLTIKLYSYAALQPPPTSPPAVDSQQISTIRMPFDLSSNAFDEEGNKCHDMEMVKSFFE
jgi:hypothetical protein